MKKKLMITLICGTMIFSSTACGSSGITQEDYDSLKKELSTVQADKETLKSEYDESLKNLDKKETEYKDLQSVYDSYKEKMKPYEELEASEAEARKIAAEKAKEDAKKAEEEKKAAEEQAAAEAAAAKAAEEEAAAAAKAAEEAKGYETGISYDNLARTPDDYLAKKVKFSGKVIQVMEGDSETQLRFAIDSDYDKVVYCAYPSSIVSTRVLEDDIITIYGSSLGLISYTSTMGGKITLPSIIVDKIES